MLKVSIDATPIRGKLSGVGVYTLSLIQAVYQLQEQENFQLEVYFHPSFKNWLLRNFSSSEFLEKNYQISLLPIPVTLANLLTKFSIPLLPYFDRYLSETNIIHGTDHYVYPYQKSRKVMSIHDLTFIKYPQYTTSIVKTYLERIKRCLTWTDLIITFSQSTKKDIIELLNVDPNRIYITPQASRYSSNFLDCHSITKLKQSISYNFNEPYLLFVSTLEPRKNILTLITAFNYLKKNYKIEHNLVLIGRKGWNYQSIFAAIANSTWQQNIYHLDYLSDDLVALFYSQADAFIYPSYYEGFGLPVLEAMTLGTPVITSNTSSLPEVTGDAALLINPDDFLELATAILKIINNSQFRDEQIQKGKERAKLFSWEKTGEATLNAYKSVL